MPDSESNSNKWLSSNPNHPANEEGLNKAKVTPQPSTIPPAPNISTNPYVVNEPPTSPYPPPHHSVGRPLKRWMTVAAVGAFLVLSAGGGLAYKTFYLDSFAAPRDLYLNSINDKSGKLKISAAINPGNTDSIITLSHITASVNGSYDDTDKKNPKMDLNINGSFASSKFSG